MGYWNYFVTLFDKFSNENLSTISFNRLQYSFIMPFECASLAFNKLLKSLKGISRLNVPNTLNIEACEGDTISIKGEIDEISG